MNGIPPLVRPQKMIHEKPDFTRHSTVKSFLIENVFESKSVVLNISVRLSRMISSHHNSQACKEIFVSFRRETSGAVAFLL